MYNQEVINELKNIIASYVKDRGLDLIDFLHRYEGRDLVLRILVDRPEGGISLGDCAELNSKIGTMLDEKNILQSGYVLEVSSPGLDRPLKTKSDFLRCVNRKVKFFVSMPIDAKIELEGVISEVDDSAVYVNTAGKVLTISLSNIIKAKQIISCI